MIHYSRGFEDTKKFAEDLVKENRGRILALVGELGSGKTTFSQFFLRALGVEKEYLTSPTFLIIKNYELRITNYEFKRAYHIDCHRLHNSKELLDLGFKEIIENPKNIVLIEWADKIRELLPSETVWLYFKHSNSPEEREINIEYK
jgi:tRNA threonylcarbamoyladenosine biosynthesis protein TsaE